MKTHHFREFDQKYGNLQMPHRFLWWCVVVVVCHRSHAGKGLYYRRVTAINISESEHCFGWNLDLQEERP